MITIIDTQTCNLRSVKNAFRRIGFVLTPTKNSKDIAQADAIILPGVGSFERGMAALDTLGLTETLISRVKNDGVPLVGICLGMQLLAESSDEHGKHFGLGLIKGRVTKLHPSEPGVPVPNIGWHSTVPTKPGNLFGDDPQSEYFYYVHSYAMECVESTDIAATIEYGKETVTVAVERGNIFGVQFHPEKSQDSGLDLLHRVFARLRKSGRLGV